MRKKSHGELGLGGERNYLRLTRNSGNTKSQQFPHWARRGRQKLRRVRKGGSYEETWTKFLGFVGTSSDRDGYEWLCDVPEQTRWGGSRRTGGRSRRRWYR